MLVFVRIFFQI